MAKKYLKVGTSTKPLEQQLKDLKAGLRGFRNELQAEFDAAASGRKSSGFGGALNRLSKYKEFRSATGVMRSLLDETSDILFGSTLPIPVARAYYDAVLEKAASIRADSPTTAWQTRKRQVAEEYPGFPARHTGEMGVQTGNFFYQITQSISRGGANRSNGIISVRNLTLPGQFYYDEDAAGGDKMSPYHSAVYNRNTNYFSALGGYLQRKGHFDDSMPAGGFWSLDRDQVKRIQSVTLGFLRDFYDKGLEKANR